MYAFPITRYMTNGLPATAQVTFLRAPVTQPISSATLSVVIGGTTYTWLPPGSSTAPGALNFFGSTSLEIARSLAAVINGDVSRNDISLATNPIAPFWAMYYGNTVTIIASVPGLIGNTYALTAASSDAQCYTLSGATFVNGSDQFPGLSRSVILVSPPGSSNGQAQIVASSTPFQQAWFYGAKAVAQIAATIGYTLTANAATVYVGELIGGKIYYTDPVVTSLSPTLMSSPQNKKFDLSNFYVLTPTSGDSVLVKYI